MPGSERSERPAEPSLNDGGRCGDPTCFCANWFDDDWHNCPAPPQPAVSQEFCEMWGEIGLAHEAAVECREFRWPPVGRTYSWLPGVQIKPATSEDYWRNVASNFRWEVPMLYTTPGYNGVFTVD